MPEKCTEGLRFACWLCMSGIVAKMKIKVQENLGPNLAAATYNVSEGRKATIWLGKASRGPMFSQSSLISDQLYLILGAAFRRDLEERPGGPAARSPAKLAPAAARQTPTRPTAI